MTSFVFLLCCITLVFVTSLAADAQWSSETPDLLVVTIATEENDGFRQFMRSVKKYNLNVKVFGLGQEWKGGVLDYPGGGHKVNILRDSLKTYNGRDDLIIMFTDSYDVVFTEGKDVILEKFSKFDAKVVFSAEHACWPDKSLETKYPSVKENEKRFLNSGGFIGYAREIYDIVNYQPIKDGDDDQLYYTNIFLSRAMRHELGIKLDSRSEIFQNLNWALGEVVLKYKGEHSYLYNIKTGTIPVVVHGNGPIKPEFNRMANYLADGWTNSAGCLSCDEDLLSLSNIKESEYPRVLISISISVPTPFLRECFERIIALDYPKEKIDVYVHSMIDFNNKEVEKFVSEASSLYSSFRLISPSDNVGEGMGRNWAINECLKHNCNYLFAVDSVAQITNPLTLKELIKQNRSIIAPFMKRPGRLWSNFWGALNKDGFYARSEDYMDIIDYKKMGVWNVPFVSSVLLVSGHHLEKLKEGFTFNMNVDPDMSFCNKARSEYVFMYVTNRDYWGHLVMAENFPTNHLHNELFDIFDNQLDWEYRYINKDYGHALKEDAQHEQPCPDVYWFPIVSDTFCDEFVAEFENYGQWSNGKNTDPRISGGYENVPTVDIHMNQIGIEKQWLYFLQQYVRPLQERVFTGYFHDPPHAIMNFIVRYRPDEQPLLRPHHDSSTYTINIALNRPNIDFEGGGCRFIRYNCSITAPRKGWMFMHPGRLTHYHEGLRVTGGTRYIMISFIDP